MSRDALRRRLLRWFREHGRDLPWRRTRDPYAIWVSEVMLQQTQVATVVPFYLRFLERFPDPEGLAAADEDEVLALWSGLGYYRRARALQRGAREVMERHAGRVPDDPETLRSLPGVGRYTAGAIASIAFDVPAPILDGNVRRVLSRIHAVDGGALGRAEEERRLWELAADLARGPEPGQLNQALMELGALVCTPSEPGCGACPVRASCTARRTDRVNVLPFRRPRPSTTRVDVAVAWIERDRRLLLERPAAASPLRGRWDLPATELADGMAAGDALERLAADHGLEIRVGPRLCTLPHGIMNRRLRLEVHRCRLIRGAVAASPRLRWMSREQRGEVAVSGATLKALRAVEPQAADRAPRSSPRT